MTLSISPDEASYDELAILENNVKYIHEIKLIMKREYTPRQSSYEGELEGFTYRLKSLRLERGVSQSEFARLMGCSQIYYRKMEKGLTRPTIFYVARLAKALGITTDYFVRHVKSVEERTEELWERHNLSARMARDGLNFDDWKTKRRVLIDLELW